MKTRASIVGLLIVAMATLPACRVRNLDVAIDEDLTHYVQAATEIEYPDVADDGNRELSVTGRPLSIGDYQQANFWNLGLEEAIQIALANSEVLRDLGGTVLRSPGTARTTLEPAIQETDPRFGIDAALSAFDADLSTSIFAEQNDERLNNQFLGNLGFLQQNYGVLEAELKKRAATGSQFILRKTVEFDKNSSLGNEFDHGWSVFVEGELRHPLLQRAGLPFNRIAGPDGSAGNINGVLIARVKTDISLAEFELGVRDLVANVENAYWDLYYAYRDLDAKIAARDVALETWRKINALAQTGRRGGEAEKEAQAREQYFQFKLEVENALTGRLLEGTRTNNGSSGGTFRGTPGIYVNERRLRFIMGIPVTGEDLIRPADEPPTTRVVFDWDYASVEALFRRAELRRQKWEVQRREMEVLANRNLLLPNLDVVGRYRVRGFGNALINSYRNTTKVDGEFDNAYQSLTSGEFQEWQLGFEFSMPIGYRQAHTAVRNAELQLARTRAVLREQEHHILHSLSDAVSDVDRAYVTMETTYNRLRAAKDQLDAVQAAFEADKLEFFVVLDSQRRLADTASQYYQAKAEYALSLRNVHFEKGSLLDYCGVSLAEGAWPNQAFLDALSLDRRRGHPHKPRATRWNPPIVSEGTYPQHTLTNPGSAGEIMLGSPPDAPLEAVPAGPIAPQPLPDAPPAPQINLSPPGSDALLAPQADLARKLERISARTDVVSRPALPAVDASPVAFDPAPATSPRPAPLTSPQQTTRHADDMRRPPAADQPFDGWAPPRADQDSPAATAERQPANDARSPQGGISSEIPFNFGLAPRVKQTPPTSGQLPAWDPTPDREQEWGDPDRMRVRGPEALSAWRLLPESPASQTTVKSNRPPADAGLPRTTAPLPQPDHHPAALPDSSQGPSVRIAGPPSRQADLSVMFGPEEKIGRATIAGKWSPTNDDARDTTDTPVATPPRAEVPPSVRMLSEPRVKRDSPRDPSDPQVRFLLQGPVRRLPPVANGGDQSPETSP